MILPRTYDPGELDYETQYYWRIEAQDNYGNSTTGPLWTFRTEVLINDPPNKPDAPDGPSFGRYLKSYTFTTSTTDPDGDLIYYRFDWDDGTFSNWIGPYESGQIVAASHSWSIQGSYAIKAQAKDEHDVESIWSDPLSISMPKRKSENDTLLNNSSNSIWFIKGLFRYVDKDEEYIYLKAISAKLRGFENGVTVYRLFFCPVKISKPFYGFLIERPTIIPRLGIGICRAWN